MKAEQVKEGNEIAPTPEEIQLIHGFMGDDYLHLPKDWNGLMPVVEKIAKMNHLSGEMERYKVISLSIATSIEVVYKAVLAFITWYNSIKKA